MSEKKDIDEMDLFSNDLDLNLDLDEITIPDDVTNTDESEKDDSENESSENDQQDDSERVASSDDRSGEEDEDASPNLYSSLATALNEQGLLPSLDLENTKIETVDDFTNVFKTEVENAVKDQLISKLGQEGYDAIEKGVSVQEYKSFEQELETLNSINEDTLNSDVDLSKQVLFQDLRNQGLSEDKALKFLERTIALGEDKLIEDAKESLENIKSFTVNKIESRKLENEKLALEQEREKEKAIAALRDNVYKTTEVIKGIPVSKAVQDKVYKNMTEIIGNDPNGNPENKFMRDRRENPLDIDTKIYYLYELTNGFKDFSKLSTKVQSRALSDLEKAYKQTSFPSQGNDPDFIKDKESYSTGFGDELVL